ncbi:MAG: hypothetical protein DRG78_06245 [Epsilonproteobacteria bacterium]|nr:MAG: hypothetical protein DRG78_06245 [Campylobacterota bacterium]
MSKEKRLQARVDNKLLLQIQKKLLLKKNNKNTSKFIRAAIDNFLDKELFHYIDNINVIIDILHDIRINLSGVPANITQLINHLHGDEEDKLISSLQALSKRNEKYIKEIDDLVSLLKPFIDKKKKKHIIMSRIDNTIYLDIIKKLDLYTNLKLDISKFIRAALKYYMDKKYYAISNKQLELARELIDNSNLIGEVTNTLNKIAFTQNVNIAVPVNDIINAANEFSEFSEKTHHTVIKLYDESVKII